MIRTFPNLIESSSWVLNFGSDWFKTSTVPLSVFKAFFSHSVACVVGSIISGVLIELRIMIAFSIDSSSAGSPSDLYFNS